MLHDTVEVLVKRDSDPYDAEETCEFEEPTAEDIEYASKFSD